jgi:hypothetical protein
MVSAIVLILLFMIKEHVNLINSSKHTVQQLSIHLNEKDDYIDSLKLVISKRETK